jgi:hypothetical protein
MFKTWCNLINLDFNMDLEAIDQIALRIFMGPNEESKSLLVV